MSSNKRARLDEPEIPRRLWLNDDLFKQLGTRYCSSEEVMDLLLAKGVCKEVDTFAVEVEMFGDRHVRVELDADFNSMAEVKRVIETEQGIQPWEVQLYRVEEKWGGGDGSSAEQEAALLPNDAVFSGPCKLQLVRQDFSMGAASNITWQGVEGDNFTAKGGVLRKVGDGRAEAASVETITHSAIATQGVSWRVGATGNTCKTGLKHEADVDFTILTLPNPLHRSIIMCMVYEHGAALTGINMGTISPGDLLSVQVKGNQVTYSHNGKVVYGSDQPPTFPLHIDALFRDLSGDSAADAETSAVDVQIVKAPE
jgi:hypothetical protein